MLSPAPKVCDPPSREKLLHVIAMQKTQKILQRKEGTISKKREKKGTLLSLSTGRKRNRNNIHAEKYQARAIEGKKQKRFSSCHKKKWGPFSPQREERGPGHTTRQGSVNPEG